MRKMPIPGGSPVFPRFACRLRTGGRRGRGGTGLVVVGRGELITRAVSTYNHIITSPGGVRPESSRAPHDLPLILQRVRQVRTEDGQDPGPRRLVPSRTSLELAAPVGLDYNPIDCRGSGCRRSAQLARRNTRLGRRPKSNVSANRRARPQLRSGIR